MEGIIVKPAEQFLSPCSSNAGDIFGDPLVLPRVGDQYQAEIPPLNCYHQWLVQKPTDIEIMTDFPDYLELELPIPIMWARREVENIKKEVLKVQANQNDAVDTNRMIEVETSEHGWISSKNKENQDAEVILKPLHTPLGNGKVGLSTLHPMIRGDKMDVDLGAPEENKTKLDQADSGYSPLLGSLGEPWRAIEHDSFLLGLYTFGKNLLLVKRFVKSKEMGDILSYYYGKFYRSNEHCRWSECRKIRGRQYIHGHKIFIGWRQQELLSRLFSHVSEECQIMLRELSRAFGEGKISLEEYVFTLKDTVGIGVLVEAVGIGKGKQDLTGIGREPVKTNTILPVRPEIPIGKACSSLTSEDIIKFLTGDFRLSKARSNDLFWEAVWPRLLARGWHSEQPKYQGFASSKHSLVFLIPGVKKFSRRRLVKGNHYFDSVSDVLNKVASDPGLLEVEIEEVKASEHKEEYRLDILVKQCPDSLSNWQHHCYLQPPVSNCNGDQVKFMIVDTSLIHGGEWYKIRELRTLPVDARNISVLSNLSSETEEGSSEESQDAAVETNSLRLNPAEDTTESGRFVESPELTSIQDNGLPNGPDLIILAGENHEDWSTGVSTNKQLRGIMKFQFGQKVRSDQSNYLAPVTKQQHLTACSLGESSPIVENLSTDTKLNEEESPYGLNSPDTCENMEFQVGPSLNLSSGSPLAQGSPDGSDQGIVDANRQVTEPSPKKPQPPSLIDLNLPHVPHNHDESGTSRSLIMSETSQQSSNGGSSTEQQPALNGQRQSTRNRPLTTRALEAIACGFLSTRKKRKRVDAQIQSDSMPRSSRLVHGRTAAGSTLKW